MPEPLNGAPLARDWRDRLVAVTWPAVTGLVSGLLLLLVLLPIAGLLFASPPGKLLRGLSDPLVGPAIRLTLATTIVSLLLIVACGTPLAWAIARRRGGFWRVLETVIELPVVLPPAVAGVALLLAFGRRGLLGPGLAAFGIGLPFSSAAVVLAQSFVAAPFYVQAAIAAFRRLDGDLVLVARTLGASWPRVFFTVAVPLSWPALAGGAALSWARALGEFGATLMFAGQKMGRTQTLPLAIYTALESDLQTAQSLSIILVAVAFALLMAIRAGARR
ncbi:MAG TPA: ABC transporter permease [Polyangia bacterium]|nr:ABC transporter permease [Polyangia bacterium]